MWLPLTLPDLQAHAADERLDAAIRSVLSAGDETTFATLKAPVIARIRSRIATWRDNVLDTRADRIPPEFHDYAALIVLSLILARPGALAGSPANQFSLTEDQRARITQAEKDLELVARGELAVTPPDGSDTQRTVVTPSIGERTRTYGRDYEDGL